MGRKLLILVIINLILLNIYGKTPELFEYSFQGITITGTVKSAMEDEPLPGVNVIEKGTQNGTITNENGFYTITVSGPGAILEFSYIGYLVENIPVEGRTRIDIGMVEDIEELDEVVVVGYGVQKKSDLTSAVSSVDEIEMQKAITQDIGVALQGRASGVYVTKNSGAPGEGAKIYIRGPGSISGTDPLWVVDGIPITGQYDLNDVESIEILKDASSAAIYGARAANGVILVTTKRGKSGKTTINFNTYHGISKAMNLYDLVNADDYARYRNEYLLSGDISSIYSDILDGTFTTPINTDWNDVLYQNGSVHNYYIDISGGNENTKVFSSFGYNNEEGTYVGTSYERYTANVNIDSKINQWLTIGNSLNLSYWEKDPKWVSDGNLLAMNPFMPVYETDENRMYELRTDTAFFDLPYTHYGVLGSDYQYEFGNPLANEMVHHRTESEVKGVGNFYVEIKPFKGLTWRSQAGGAWYTKRDYQYTERHYQIYADQTALDDRLQDERRYGGDYTVNSF